MADKKITDLCSITNACLATGDLLVVEDVTACQCTKSISVAQLDLRWNPTYVQNQLSTGLIETGNLSITPATCCLKFSLSAGKGIVVDNHTCPDVPTQTIVSWTAFACQDPVCIATQTVTHIGINICGAITKQSCAFTDTQLRDIIQVGVIAHPGIAILSTIDQPRPPASPYHNLSDLSNAVGILNTCGNAYGAAGANLNLNKTTGKTFKLGLNFPTSKKNPNVVDNAAQLPISSQIFYEHRDGCGGHTFLAPSSLVDPTKYDDGSGTLACVPCCSYTIQRIYFTPSAQDTAIVYGTALYCSLAEALGARETESTDVAPVLLVDFSFRGWLAVKGSAVALNNAADASFVDAGKFGQASGSGATSSTTTLQEAYDNSAEPEIVLTCLDGALNIQDACGGLCADLFKVSDFGDTVNYFKVDDSKVVMNVPAAAPADCTLCANNITFYLCETCNTIHAKAKESGCSIINKQITIQPHWVINGGKTNAANGTNIASYGDSGTTGGIPMLRAGEIVGVSVSVPAPCARTVGCIQGRFAINGTPDACNISTINACMTISDATEFGTPVSYSAGDLITLCANLTSFAPSNPEITLVLWVRDT